ncbi:hypothetical protein KD050_02010 [Psychrobacillus sp. INOP01]|uniref:hypothetical protein n=1 Tax=Psychrobacillus sp. INOP01 TaxID=2829187 RepID=UPI001BABAA76|nr:hypothetical protein [Psychrobacillus sp. INOP01]QUG42096.1 hypothetical protein KD050_02010 [Psychrobacillus sp. INOP01]
MKNSHGFSWPETILSLSITFLISTTILPVVNSMIVQLEDKKRDYHSSLVMYEIAKLYTAENIPTGAMQVDGVIYSYDINDEKICIDYEGMREEQRKCVPIIK